MAYDRYGLDRYVLHDLRLIWPMTAMAYDRYGLRQLWPMTAMAYDPYGL